ncbi:phospho-sugar mutase [Brevibacillus dissolubilis]|uniref:phospho-sugar mutase n=1 Tax=Brevibacillus dissolubilis TaxID=1844116 RepID=UPI001116E9E3|nr:phospho-sugar mutase [Brevibacillus dissolubilis]
MNAVELYQHWLTSPYVDEETKQELRSLHHNPKEVEDRFYKQVEFGTGGMRGILGAGTNRINRYTIGRATQGLADYLLSLGADVARKGVVIAHDSRHQSAELSLEAACILVANGIRVYLFDSLRPTPELSFAVRELGAQAGIVVTASHNPSEYNGYKVYAEDGSQIVASTADAIISAIAQVQDFSDVRRLSREAAEETGLLQWIGSEIDQAYVTRLAQMVLNPEHAGDLSIVYTPLHGAGNLLIQRVLRVTGFTQLHVVPQQEQPDPNFSTVRYPNPEEREAFALAIRLARETNADIIVGTDPDCDRVGAVVRNREGEYQVLTGNQTGALLLSYLLSEKAKRGLLPTNATMIKTIVTSSLGEAIATDYGVKTINTLTGFKYIAEQIRQFERTCDRQFAFGYEESYGYLADTFVREKDAVMATLLICEMAAFYKAQGQTLYDALQDLYQRYGYHLEALESRTLTGKDGVESIRSIMESWRNHPPLTIAGQQVKELRDYASRQALNLLTQERTPLTLPKENALFFLLQDGSWFCLRPSGTEPKIKFYFAVQADTEESAKEKLSNLRDEVMKRIDSIEVVT